MKIYIKTNLNINNFKKKAARVARSKHRQNVKYVRIDTEKARRLGASGKWRICNSKHHPLPKPCLVTAQQEFIDNYSSLSNVEIRPIKKVSRHFSYLPSVNVPGSRSSCTETDHHDIIK